jgi:putative tributyrin esterase
MPEVREALLDVFGAPGSAVRKNNDVFDLLRSAGPKDIPYFYLGCGAGDDFLAVNRKFAAELSSREFPYEYHETPGKHGWEYWDGALPDLLRAASKAMTK